MQIRGSIVGVKFCDARRRALVWFQERLLATEQCKSSSSSIKADFEVVKAVDEQKAHVEPELAQKLTELNKGPQFLAE